MRVMLRHPKGTLQLTSLDAAGGCGMLQLRIIPLELGHIVVGIGQPDDKNFPGPAPLPGSDDSRRLIVSAKGEGSNSGHLLVKEEWDRIEQWLQIRIDTPE